MVRFSSTFFPSHASLLSLPNPPVLFPEHSMSHLVVPDDLGTSSATGEFRSLNGQDLNPTRLVSQPRCFWSKANIKDPNPDTISLVRKFSLKHCLTLIKTNTTNTPLPTPTKCKTWALSPNINFYSNITLFMFLSN